MRLPHAPALAFALLLATPAPAGRLLAQGIPPVPVPPGNPITLAKANLGKTLFWEEQLASTRTVACGTCHLPGSGGSDPLSAAEGVLALHPGFDGILGTADDGRGSPGVVRNLASGQYEPDAIFGLDRQVTSRKAPSMINAAFAPQRFWDGRAGPAFEDPLTGAVLLLANGALEAQAVEPPQSAVEMAHVDRGWSEVAARVAAVEPLALATDVPAALAQWIAGRSYPELFAEAFGSSDVTPARIVMAIATYQRTLVSDQSPFDAVLAGVPGALTPQQAQGRQVFNGPGRCNLCHGGPLLTGQGFRNIGVRPPIEDLGRFLVTGDPADRGRFKVPSLRNVALRAPYFHNGSMPSLEDVVEFYDRGGDFPQNQDPLIQPLGLTPQQKTNLVAFLEALTDPRVAAELPPFDRPALYSESERVPHVFGSGAPGSGGHVPRFVALEPALVGNPSLTLALDAGLPGAAGFLAFDVLLSPPDYSVAGVPFLLAASPAMQLVPLPPLLGAAPGEGWLSISAAIPANPSLAGLDLYLQAFFPDPAGPHGLSATAGLAIGFFGG